MPSRKEAKYLGYALIFAALLILGATFAFVLMINTPMIRGLPETREVLDCGNDERCFRDAALLCRKAKMVYVLEGVNGKVEFLYECLGRTDNYCIFRKTLKRVVVNNEEKKIAEKPKICRVPADNTELLNVLFDMDLEEKFCE
ncbi:MAG: hypothetical protein DRO04_02800 [Candidatus Iainarchaeum archaeon]|uniref:Uncharacterized protein n=1 Tax=Candidatus Iainarchaeum sp. TaxID=3101447 RepID=A0A497JIY2_9ARCH|nr:MAG: hypothetical protein DRO04_02800 [Candidatus Diapherotrites archaeon]